MHAHTQHIDPRSLRVSRQRPWLDKLAAAAIGIALASGLVIGWSA